MSEKTDFWVQCNNYIFSCVLPPYRKLIQRNNSYMQMCVITFPCCIICFMWLFCCICCLFRPLYSLPSLCKVIVFFYLCCCPTTGMLWSCLSFPELFLCLFLKNSEGTDNLLIQIYQQPLPLYCQNIIQCGVFFPVGKIFQILHIKHCFFPVK